MSMPATWGGPEMSLRQQVELVEALAVADPSVGWCVMIGSDSGFYSAFFHDAVARGLWTDLDDVTAGLIMPAGRATPVDGGFHVSGRWQFGSGCTHADVMIGGCLVVGDDGAPRLDEQGQPLARIIVARADRFEILDTWYTTGLAGSGSNDYRCEDLFVPAEHTFWFGEPVRRPGALFAFPGAFFANMQGVGLGLARRAIDEVVGIAATKVLMPQFALMRDVPRVREAVAEAEGKVRALRAYVYDAIDAVWARLCAGERLTDQERIDLLLSRVQSFRVARDVAQAMVQLAGTQAIYATCVLDRLLRDAVTINQHVVAGPVMAEAAGQLKLGQQPTGPIAPLL
jgi:alkylation response protein AidB-like acyl-CoA dehydrogenase